MRVAVFGATGFVGKSVLRRLAHRGHDAVLFSRTGAHGTIWDACGELSTEARDVLQSCAGVCYLAAHLPKDYEDPGEAASCLEVNALGILRVLDAVSIGTGVVYTSSAALYAGLSGTVAEDAPVYPSRRATYYLASKLAGELYVLAASRQGRVRGCVLRLASVYGAGMTRSNAFSTFLGALRTGREIVLRDGGLFRTDFVHVEDVAAAVVAALECEASGTFNVASGALTTMKEAVDLLAGAISAIEPRIRVESGNVPPDSVPHLDISAAEAGFGFRPRSFAEGACEAGSW